MGDIPRLTSRSRDEPCRDYHLGNAVHGTLPSRATDNYIQRSRAPSPTSKSSQRESAIDTDTASSPPRSMALSRNNLPVSWIHRSKKRNLLQYDQRMELHHSTCLNLNTAADDNVDSDLWILPDFDDWEVENEQPAPARNQHAEWAPLLRRAAKSNLERLRARLEGDGWAFVGGKYEEDKRVLQEAADQREESVDEEFDVVVLPAVHVSC